MSDDRIQASAPSGTAPAQLADEEALVDQLMRRVQTLEEERRRWKHVALGSLCVLVLVLGAGIFFSVGGPLLYWNARQREEAFMRAAEAERSRAEAERLRAEAAAERARIEAERARLEDLQAAPQPEEPREGKRTKKKQ